METNDRKDVPGPGPVIEKVVSRPLQKLTIFNDILVESIVTKAPFTASRS